MSKLDLQRISHAFLLYASIAVFSLRLFLPVFFKGQYNYVWDELSGLITASLIFLMGAVFLFKKKAGQEPLLQSGFELPIGLFFIASCWSVTHSVYCAGSMLYLVTLAAYLVYFYILIDLLKEQRARGIFLGSFLMAAIVIGLVAIREYFLPSASQLHATDQHMPIVLPYRRVGSLFGAPNVLAGFYMLVLPLLGAVWMLAEKRWQKITAGTLMAVFLTAFLMTLSFLCTVNFFIATVLMSALIMKEWFNKPIGKVFFVGILFCMAAFFALILLVRHDFSIGSRLEYLKAAWLLLQNNFWLGTGIDTFRYLSPQYTYTQTYSGYVHNSYLQIWVETGVLGFIAILLLVGTFIKISSEALNSAENRHQRIITIALVWALSAFFIDNLTNFTMLSPDIALFGWMALAGFCAVSSPQRTEGKTNPVLLILSWSFIIVFLFKSVSLSLSYFHFQKAMEALQKREYVASYALLEKAKTFDKNNQNFYATQGLIDMDVYQLTKDEKLLSEAQKKFEEAARLSFYYYPNYIMLSKIARAQGDVSQLKAYLRRLKALCPGGYPYFKSDIFSTPQKSKRLTGAR